MIVVVIVGAAVVVVIAVAVAVLTIRVRGTLIRIITPIATVLRIIIIITITAGLFGSRSQYEIWEIT